MTDLFAEIVASDFQPSNEAAKADMGQPLSQSGKAAPKISKLRKNASLPLGDHTKGVYDCSTAACRCDACQIERGEAGPFNDVEDRDEPAAHIPRAPAHLACNLTVLALDLGTTTGWALAPRNGALRSGSFRLDPHKLGGNGRRWIAFREWLTATAREAGGVQVVYVEDVRRHVSNLSARVYCGYLAMLEAWCAANNVRLEGVGVGTVKKHFTGKGNADKGEMIAEAKRRGFTVTDDNNADALAILAYGVAQES